MSKTFAVETYSGGSIRIASIWAWPSLRSFFSLARLTLTLCYIAARYLYCEGRSTV